LGWFLLQHICGYPAVATLSCLLLPHVQPAAALDAMAGMLLRES